MRPSEEENRFPQDVYWMQQALAEAEKAKLCGEVPIGAVVVHEGKIIGYGHNARERLCDPTAHAEMIAIRMACMTLGAWRLLHCDLYVTLEPCPMCAGAIVQARMRRLIYGTSDPKAGYTGSLHNVCQDTRLNHTVAITPHVLQQPCATILTTFFRSLRQRP